jgi:lipopolysaccharide export system ATP-binding protein
LSAAQKGFIIRKIITEKKKLKNDSIEKAKLYGKDIVKIYGKRTVVNKVNVSVNQGEIVGLLGPNGAGKTTTFYMITGMIKPNKGDIYMNDTVITGYPMYKRARLGVAYLPQEASIFRKLSVENNLIAIMEMIGIPKKEQRERCDKLLEELNITHIAKSLGYMLSGGERRRTEIARTLVTNPKFILLDEPFAGVDPIAVEDIQQIVHSLKDRGIGVLITDHNVHETLSITDRAYLLFEGRILKEGTAEYLAEDEESRKIYLGENFKLDR